VSISLKSAREIDSMRDAGRIVADTLQELRGAIEPGMTTRDIDRLVERSLRRQGAIPAFPFINDFPGTVCTSVNEEVVHAIPSMRQLREGDLVKLDVGAIYDGYHGDAAITVAVGEVSLEARRLMRVTDDALALGVETAQPGSHLYDIGAAIQSFVESQGFSVVRQYVGHGIGRELHEDPQVPHYKQNSRGVKLRPGMTFTIEPMVNAGTHETVTLPDEWTVITKDRRLSAQFEHTVAITDHGPEVLTRPSIGESWGLSFEGAKVVQS
jgi:methionyl aminopeptidase